MHILPRFLSILEKNPKPKVQSVVIRSNMVYITDPSKISGLGVDRIGQKRDFKNDLTCMYI